MANARRTGEKTARAPQRQDYVGAQPTSRMRLAFLDHSELELVDARITEDISALATIGRTLFCACDETATVERLVWDDEAGTFTGHQNFAVGHAFDLPDGIDGEMDIEGLAVADGYLWITGSHSLKRSKPEAFEGAVEGLSDVDWDKNRGFLGRFPLLETDEGVFEPVNTIDQLDGMPSGRRAAMFEMGSKGDKALRKLLGDDPLLARFMAVPCKENGFDVEGLAVRDDRIYLGLRGPVLGSHALIVEIRFRETKKGKLKPADIDGKPYRICAVDLEGLGIRDMLFDNDTLLLLAGATQNIDAIQRVYAVRNFATTKDVITARDVEIVLPLPIREHCDHAEGLAIFEIDGSRRLLVAYDSPSDDRHDPKSNRLDLDVYAFR